MEGCRIKNLTPSSPKRLRSSSRSRDILQLPFVNYQNRSAGPERSFLNLLRLLHRTELMVGAVRVRISIPLLPCLCSYHPLGQHLEGSKVFLQARLVSSPSFLWSTLQNSNPCPNVRMLMISAWHEAPKHWCTFQPHFLSQNELVAKMRRCNEGVWKTQNKAQGEYKPTA